MIMWPPEFECPACGCKQIGDMQWTDEEAAMHCNNCGYFQKVLREDIENSKLSKGKQLAELDDFYGC